VLPSGQWPTHHVLRLVAGGISVGLSVEGDVDLKKALDRLLKQMADADKEAARLAGKLENADFVSKAPSDVIADHRQRLQTLSRDRAMLLDSERQLRAMLEA
jgi:valyl-tRNA synthetase